jgi:hypothetical protein
MAGIAARFFEYNSFDNQHEFQPAVEFLFEVINFSLKCSLSFDTFAPMKKWLGYILGLYVLFSAVIPCAIVDNCDEGEKTEQRSGHEENDNCDNCPPFCNCSSGHGFTFNTLAVTIAPADLYTGAKYNFYNISSKSDYYSSFFQPPRFG